MPGAQPGDRPVLLHCRAPGAMQMNCPDGSRKHDMIVTAVPGDVRYSPISPHGRPAPAFNPAQMLYTTEAGVHAGIGRGRLTYTLGLRRLSPIVAQ